MKATNFYERHLNIVLTEAEVNELADYLRPKVRNAPVRVSEFFYALGDAINTWTDEDTSDV